MVAETVRQGKTRGCDEPLKTSGNHKDIIRSEGEVPAASAFTPHDFGVGDRGHRGLKSEDVAKTLVVKINQRKIISVLSCVSQKGTDTQGDQISVIHFSMLLQISITI